MHAVGFVHCDIKPDNIMCTKSGRATLIDFGLAHKFVDAKGQHIPYMQASHFKGTYNFCSKNTLEKVKQTRRDDLEALFYTIMRLCNVKMPWIPQHCKQREQYMIALRSLKTAMPDFVVMRVSALQCLL